MNTERFTDCHRWFVRPFVSSGSVDRETAHFKVFAKTGKSQRPEHEWYRHLLGITVDLNP